MNEWILKHVYIYFHFIRKTIEKRQTVRCTDGCMMYVFEMYQSMHAYGSNNSQKMFSMSKWAVKPISKYTTVYFNLFTEVVPQSTIIISVRSKNYWWVRRNYFNVFLKIIRIDWIIMVFLIKNLKIIWKYKRIYNENKIHFEFVL